MGQHLAVTTHILIACVQQFVNTTSLPLCGLSCTGVTVQEHPRLVEGAQGYLEKHQHFAATFLSLKTGSISPEAPAWFLKGRLLAIQPVLVFERSQIKQCKCLQN